MATKNFDNDPLDLNLYNEITDEADDESSVFYKKLLTSLVQGESTPSAAATTCDTWIVQVTNERYEKVKQRPDPYNLTPEEEEAGIHLRGLMPNASGEIHNLAHTLARLCTAFPANHPGQDRIIQFLEALRAMPQHRVLDELYEDRGLSECEIALWPFGGNWEATGEMFRRRSEDISYPYSDVENPGSDMRYRWSNFQSAIARITVGNFIDLGFLCALNFILPSHFQYPDLKSRKIGGPNRISGDAIAGSLWLLLPEVGRYVYHHCQKKARVDKDNPRDMWSRERWEEWRKQYGFIAGDERFDEQARKVAESVLEQMAVYENEEITRSV